MSDTNVQLSKWWKTKSCQDAYERAAMKRAERIAKLTAANKRRQDEAEATRAELDALIWGRN